MSKEQKREVEFKFVKPSDYKVLFANGVHGGMTPRGNFVMHFFHEYLPPPPVEVITLDEKGKIQEIRSLREEEEKKAGRSIFTRDLVVGITMPPEQAVSIANWILDKVKVIPSSEEKEAGTS